MTEDTNNFNESPYVQNDVVEYFINDIRREYIYFLTNVNSYSKILARTATVLKRVSMASKVFIIFLGAIAATSGTFSVLYGEENPIIVWIFTIVGLLIATLSGLDAAFKFEVRASARLSLAADISSSLFRYSSEYGSLDRRINMMLEESPVNKDAFDSIQDEFKVIQNNQIEYLNNINQRSAEVGVNLKWEQQLDQHELDLFGMNLSLSSLAESPLPPD